MPLLTFRFRQRQMVYLSPHQAPHRTTITRSVPESYCLSYCSAGAGSNYSTSSQKLELHATQVQASMSGSLANLTALKSTSAFPALSPKRRIKMQKSLPLGDGGPGAGRRPCYPGCRSHPTNQSSIPAWHRPISGRCTRVGGASRARGIQATNPETRHIELRRTAVSLVGLQLCTDHKTVSQRLTYPSLFTFGSRASGDQLSELRKSAGIGTGSDLTVTLVASLIRLIGPDGCLPGMEDSSQIL
ncbi:hypothetical protein RRG08_050576 [Elysia crispata]|uniref:Uncharacterized protein n=1 Tax=Elysia crispata TaxID=231223 RepID=A0AAE0Z6V1_9GAST|nr:hypothetical protein RRG08_050576 [Elysia crispata]